MFCKRPGARTHRPFSSLEPPPRLAYIRSPLKKPTGPEDESVHGCARAVNSLEPISLCFSQAQPRQYPPPHPPTHRKFSKQQTKMMILWMKKRVEWETGVEGKEYYFWRFFTITKLEKLFQ